MLFGISDWLVAILWCALTSNSNCCLLRKHFLKLLVISVIYFTSVALDDSMGSVEEIATKKQLLTTSDFPQLKVRVTLLVLLYSAWCWSISREILSVSRQEIYLNQIVSSRTAAFAVIYTLPKFNIINLLTSFVHTLTEQFNLTFPTGGCHHVLKDSTSLWFTKMLTWRRSTLVKLLG